jgi:quinol monooxygenase YgiN
MSSSEIFIFEFHSREEQADAVMQAIKDVATPTIAEPGCLAYGAYRSSRDPQLFFIYSRWIDQTAFDRHTNLPHAVRFQEIVEPLIDHTLEVNRTTAIVPETRKEHQ